MLVKTYNNKYNSHIRLFNNNGYIPFVTYTVFSSLTRIAVLYGTKLLSFPGIFSCN